MLVDRGGRELPIQPDYAVRRVEVPEGRRVEVARRDGELWATLVHAVITTTEAAR